MDADRHRIHSAVFEFTFDSNTGGEDPATVLAELLRTRALPEVESVLDEFSTPETVTVLDTLEIDLGILPWDGLDDTLPARLAEALREALRERLPPAPDARHPGARRLSHGESDLETLWAFLVSGRLPWRATELSAGEFDALSRRVVASEARGLAEALRSRGPGDAAISRLVRQIPRDALLRFLASLPFDDPARLDRRLGEISERLALALPPGGRRSAEETAFLERLLQEALGRQDRIPVDAVVARALRRVRWPAEGGQDDPVGEDPRDRLWLLLLQDALSGGGTALLAPAWPGIVQERPGMVVDLVRTEAARDASIVRRVARDFPPSMLETLLELLGGSGGRVAVDLLAAATGVAAAAPGADEASLTRSLREEALAHLVAAPPGGGLDVTGYVGALMERWAREAGGERATRAREAMRGLERRTDLPDRGRMLLRALARMGEAPPTPAPAHTPGDAGTGPDLRERFYTSVLRDVLRGGGAELLRSVWPRLMGERPEVLERVAREEAARGTPHAALADALPPSLLLELIRALRWDAAEGIARVLKRTSPLWSGPGAPPAHVRDAALDAAWAKLLTGPPGVGEGGLAGFLAALLGGWAAEAGTTPQAEAWAARARLAAMPGRGPAEEELLEGLGRAAEEAESASARDRRRPEAREGGGGEEGPVADARKAFDRRAFAERLRRRVGSRPTPAAPATAAEQPGDTDAPDGALLFDLALRDALAGGEPRLLAALWPRSDASLRGRLAAIARAELGSPRVRRNVARRFPASLVESLVGALAGDAGPLARRLLAGWSRLAEGADAAGPGAGSGETLREAALAYVAALTPGSARFEATAFVQRLLVAWVGEGTLPLPTAAGDLARRVEALEDRTASEESLARVLGALAAGGVPPARDEADQVRDLVLREALRTGDAAALAVVWPDLARERPTRVGDVLRRDGASEAVRRRVAAGFPPALLEEMVSLLVGGRGPRAAHVLGAARTVAEGPHPEGAATRLEVGTAVGAEALAYAVEVAAGRTEYDDDGYRARLEAAAVRAAAAGESRLPAAEGAEGVDADAGERDRLYALAIRDALRGGDPGVLAALWPRIVAQRPDLASAALVAEAGSAAARRRIVEGLPPRLLEEMISLLAASVGDLSGDVVASWREAGAAAPTPSSEEVVEAAAAREETLAFLAEARTAGRRFHRAEYASRPAGRGVRRPPDTPGAGAPAAPEVEGRARRIRMYDGLDQLRGALLGLPLFTTADRPALESVVGGAEEGHPGQLLRIFRELGDAAPATVAARLPGTLIRRLLEAFLALRVARGEELARAIRLNEGRVRHRGLFLARVLSRLASAAPVDFEALLAEDAELPAGAPAPERHPAPDMPAEEGDAPDMAEVVALETASLREAVLRAAAGGAEVRAVVAGRIAAMLRATGGTPPEEIRPLLADAAARHALASVLPEHLLARLILLFRPGAYADARLMGDVLEEACLDETVGAPRERVSASRWASTLDSLFGEGPAFTPRDFEAMLLQHLAEALDVAPGSLDAARARLLEEGPRMSADQEDALSPGARRTTGDPSPAPPEEVGDGELFVTNAGLVLVAPFLPRLFDRVGLLDRETFRDREAAVRGAQLLQFVATGGTDAPEFLLPLNRVLCGLDSDTRIPRTLAIRDEEAEAVEGLLRSVIAHWGALGSTTVAGLREAFLQRDGRLRPSERGWELRVEPRAFDMLLDRVPWTFRTLSLPWMDSVLYVEWR